MQYDQRGYGKSGKPLPISAYTLDKLAADFGAVIDKTAPHKRVHVVGVEWGPYAFSEYNQNHKGRIASFTSLGSPSIDINATCAKADITSSDKAEQKTARQYYASSLFFYGLANVPVIPSAIMLSGMPALVVNSVSDKLAGKWDAHLQGDEMYYGLKMMKANTLKHGLHPSYSFLDVPLLQVIDMSMDILPSAYVTSTLEKHTNRLLLRKLRALRNTIVVYPVSIANWVNEAVRVVEAENPSVK